MPEIKALNVFAVVGIIACIVAVGYLSIESSFSPASQGAVTGEIAAGCPNSGMGFTTELVNGSAGCGTFLTIQTAVSTEAPAGCPNSGMAFTTESANGNAGCATFLTTQTAVSTELSQTCVAGQFAKGEDSGGNMICNTPSSNIQGIGLTGGTTKQYFLLSTSSATETNVLTPVSNNGVLTGFYCTVQTGFTGTITWKVRMGNIIVMSDTALNVTQTNPQSGFVYSDATHTVNIPVGDFIDFSVVMSTAGNYVTQCSVSFSKS